MSIQTYLPIQRYDFQAPQVSWGEIDRFASPADEIPALAGTLAQLELLLKAPIVDLEVAARLVRSDLGLSIQALRQAWIESKGSEQPWRISDCVVVLGLRLLDVARPLHCGVKHKFAYSEAEAFWKYAGLVATVSEQTATYFDELGIDPEQAYLAGLMHNFNRLPDVLEAVGFLESGESLQLVDCNLPSFINDVVESTASDRLPVEMNSLSRVVSFSKRWIDLCLPWSETCMAQRNRFSMPVHKAVSLIYQYLPCTNAETLMPLMEILKKSTCDQLENRLPEPS
jgi:hypothetical protein